MSLQGLTVIRVLVVAEQRPEPRHVRLVAADQQIPVIMADFVTEMTDQRSMTFREIDTQFLPFNRIRLTNVNGDLSARMTGINRFLGMDSAP